MFLNTLLEKCSNVDGGLLCILNNGDSMGFGVTRPEILVGDDSEWPFPASGLVGDLRGR